MVGEYATIYIMTKWHSLALGDVFARLDAKKEGLNEREAEFRLKKNGLNKLEVKVRDNTFLVFLRQFLSPLILLLFFAGIVSVLLGAHLDAIVIFIAVLFNTAIGFYQERRALETFHKLIDKQEYFAWALRDGNWRQVSSQELVPGDIIVLKPGDRVPADARLTNIHGLSVNEAVLTGEAMSSDKSTDIISENVALADRANMIWMGTAVTDGKAEAIVVSTGMKTEFGKIHSMLRNIKESKTPFEKKVVRLSRFLTAVILAFTVFIFLLGSLLGHDLTEMFLIAVAVAVSAIPEGLPIAVTVILAIGMTKILKKRGLIKRLAATEALGSTSVILIDKTGTLTQGKMQVSRVITAVKERGVLELSTDGDGGSNQFMALEIGMLTSEAIIENPHDELHDLKIRGRPTDTALVMAGIQAGLSPEQLSKKYQVIDEVPFNSDRKFTASVQKRNDDKIFSFFSGAPEVLLQYIKRVQIGERSYILANDELTDIKNTVNSLANEGLRVILVGYKIFPKIEALPKKIIDHQWTQLLEEGTFVGLVAIKDPVREDLAEVIDLTHKAGIRTVIVTGDHALTARSVAKEIGLLKKGKTMFNVMEGKELAEIDPAELSRQVRAIDIFARVSPIHKVKIVDAWQRQGETVAMGGDGVNDAPAIKKADVGIAVGTGTDIAKEAADIVLLDNNFSTIIFAIKEGRVILDNLKKVITYLLSDSFTEIILISFCLLAGLPIAVLPAQILWVNLIEGSFPSIALALDPAEKDVMSLPPSSTKKPLIDKEMKFLILVIGILTDLILVGIFLFFLSQDGEIEYIRTVVFAALAINSLFYSFSMRSLRRPLWKIKFWNNKYLLGAVGLGMLLIFAAVYLPPLQTLLRTVSLGSLEWIIIFGFGILNIIAIEMGKWIFIHRRKYKHLQA